MYSQQAMSAMVMLEVPHVNVLTKMDTVQNKKHVKECVSYEPMKPSIL